MRVRMAPEPMSLCERCAQSIVAYRASGERLVSCAVFKRVVPPDITTCNGYYPIGQMLPTPWTNAAPPIILDVRPTPGQAL